MTIRLSRRALKDIQDIKSFTLKRWGTAAWLHYFAGLSAALDRVNDDPASGRSRDIILSGMRSLTYERHLIFFMSPREGSGRTTVLRIVHQARHLSALSYADDLER